MGRARSPTIGQVSGKPVSEAVLDAIANREGTSPLTFDQCLYEAIDPDALDALFQGGWQGVSVEFSFAGYWIAIADGGRISVTEQNV